MNLATWRHRVGRFDARGSQSFCQNICATGAWRVTWRKCPAGGPLMYVCIGWKIESQGSLPEVTWCKTQAHGKCVKLNRDLCVSACFFSDSLSLSVSVSVCLSVSLYPLSPVSVCLPACMHACLYALMHAFLAVCLPVCLSPTPHPPAAPFPG